MAKKFMGREIGSVSGLRVRVGICSWRKREKVLIECGSNEKGKR